VRERAAGKPICSPGLASVAGSAPPSREVHPAITVGGYIALFLLGMVEGLVGTFWYSRGPGVLVAVLFDAAIFVTCMLGAWGMRTALGGVLPALGWFVVTLVLSSSSVGGSVIVTDTAAGKWFLFGGSLCAAAGAVYAFWRWSRASREHRAG
jgi:hypothetical protein